MKLFHLSFGLLLLCLSLPSQAATFRCGSKLVSLGDRTFQVLQKCGEPSYREALGYELSDYPYYRREAPISEWVYGPRNGFIYFLRFEGNRLAQITSQRAN